jgi:hypothetical protein
MLPPMRLYLVLKRPGKQRVYYLLCLGIGNVEL